MTMTKRYKKIVALDSLLGKDTQITNSRSEEKVDLDTVKKDLKTKQDFKDFTFAALYDFRFLFIHFHINVVTSNREVFQLMLLKLCHNLL